jgi:predicted RNase H-like nuclease (RuvC/YqgF family)
MDNPLVGMEPPTDSIAPWWPLIGVGISMVVAAVSAIWAAWMQFRQWRQQRDEKIIDKEREYAITSEQRKQAVEIEELKLSFDQRSKLLDALQGQIKDQLAEGREMRKELAAARAELVSRDKMIGELQTTITQMQLRIKQLEREVEAMEAVQKMHIRQAHTAGGSQS